MGNSLDLTAELLHDRWRRAVDLLWKETVRRHQAGLQGLERIRSARRLRNLQKIVRKALAAYHQIEIERQSRAERGSVPRARPLRPPRKA